MLTVTVFLNMYSALTNPFYDNPGVSDWLGIGPALRAESGVALIALANGAVFLWAFAQLRPNALARLRGELALERSSPWTRRGRTNRTTGPCRRRWAGRRRAGGRSPWPAGRQHSPAPPRAGRPSPCPGGGRRRPDGVVVAAPDHRRRRRHRLVQGPFQRDPVRPDRSATLRHEGGGRLDRLDLFLIVLLILGTMLLRTFRLAEPYQMHFDEVYHARTATEFLQSWRYGLSHDIYEWTHPHLAKYAMAAGIVAFGNDKVNATSDLGVPVVAAAVEPRRIDEIAPGGQAGERLHIATGTEIRTYDLASRDLCRPCGRRGDVAGDRRDRQPAGHRL